MVAEAPGRGGGGDRRSDERGEGGGREKAVRARTWTLGGRGLRRMLRTFAQTCSSKGSLAAVI